MNRISWYIIIAVIIGGLIPIQSSINAHLGQFMKHPLLATFINFLGGILLLFVLVFIVVKPSLPPLTVFKDTPLYLYFGGFIGVTFVTAVVFLTPKIGITNMLAGAIVGQLVISSIIDHFGWFNLPVSPITITRLAGIAFLFIGIYLTQK